MTRPFLWRRILINNARRKYAVRHCGGRQRVGIEEVEVTTSAKREEMLAVDEALEKLAARDKTKAELIKLIYFVGLTISEAASILGISEPTAKRHRSYARGWLFSTIEVCR